MSEWIYTHIICIFWCFPTSARCVCVYIYCVCWEPVLLFCTLHAQLRERMHSCGLMAHPSVYCYRVSPPTAFPFNHSMPPDLLRFSIFLNCLFVSKHSCSLRASCEFLQLKSLLHFSAVLEKTWLTATSTQLNRGVFRPCVRSPVDVVATWSSFPRNHSLVSGRQTHVYAALFPSSAAGCPGQQRHKFVMTILFVSIQVHL